MVSEIFCGCFDFLQAIVMILFQSQPCSCPTRVFSQVLHMPNPSWWVIFLLVLYLYNTDILLMLNFRQVMVGIGVGSSGGGGLDFMKSQKLAMCLESHPQVLQIMRLM